MIRGRKINGISTNPKKLNKYFTMEKERDDKFLRMNFHLFWRQKYFLGQTSLFFSHKHINPVRKRHYLNAIRFKISKQFTKDLQIHLRMIIPC